MEYAQDRLKAKKNPNQLCQVFLQHSFHSFFA